MNINFRTNDFYNSDADWLVFQADIYIIYIYTPHPTLPLYWVHCSLGHESSQEFS